MSLSDYEKGYRAAQFDAFAEASIQVLRDTGDYPHIPPSDFEGEYGQGAAAVMNWLNREMNRPVPPREDEEPGSDYEYRAAGSPGYFAEGSKMHAEKLVASPDFPMYTRVERRIKAGAWEEV